MQEPISLYLQLEQGSRADLEVVSRASIAFSDAIKELAFLIDPSTEVRVVFANGTDGSLSLNSFIKGIEDKTGISRSRLKLIALVVVLWFGKEISSYFLTKILDHVMEAVEEEQITPAEAERLKQIVERAVDGKLVNNRVRDVFLELERDKSITGVGATQKHGERPESIIPRAEFNVRAGIDEIVTDSTVSRTKRSQESLMLISPVLLHGNRKWKFRQNGIEFGAAIRDEKFLADLLNGINTIAMVSGIELDVLMETKEEKIDNVWVTKERIILKVLNTTPVARQSLLPLAMPRSREDESDN